MSLVQELMVLVMTGCWLIVVWMSGMAFGVGSGRGEWVRGGELSVWRSEPSSTASRQQRRDRLNGVSVDLYKLIRSGPSKEM